MKRILFFAMILISISAFGQVTLPASSYQGADASVKINACIADVITAGGGTCDANGLGGSQTMSQQINLGSTAQVAANIGVTLLLPDTATWTWHLTDGVSCGIWQYSSTSLIGHQPGAGGNRMRLYVSSGAKMDSIYCTDKPANGSSYIHAEGFGVINNQPGSTFANGVIHIRDIVDQSSFVRIFGENYYGDAWHIEGACCGDRFENIHGVTEPSIAGGLPGGTPLTLTGMLRDISFYDSSFNQPGLGKSDIFINSGYAFEINFYNVYMEGNGVVDSASPMVYIGKNTGPVHFFGGFANTEQAFVNHVVPATKPVIANYGLYVSLEALGVANTSVGIYDHSQTLTTPVTVSAGIWGTEILEQLDPTIHHKIDKYQNSKYSKRHNNNTGTNYHVAATVIP